VTCAAGKEPGKHVVLLWSTDVLLLLQQHLCWHVSCVALTRVLLLLLCS
jgi:hypothetical protein